MSRKRKRGGEKKRKSRDLSNRSLKTESREPTQGSLEIGREEERKRESRGPSNRSLKTDGETDSGELT